jgi:hypothetical protein
MKAAMIAITKLAEVNTFLRAKALAELLPQCPMLEKRMQRYVQFLAMQATHLAACNRVHEVNERLARWLLSCDPGETILRDRGLSYVAQPGRRQTMHRCKPKQP